MTGADTSSVPVSRWRRISSPVVVGGMAALGALALHLRDPHVDGSWGFCPFQVMTGLDCPLCGGLRAVNLLTHLDVVGAASSNLMVVVAIPVVLALWVRRLVACWRGGDAMRPLPVPSGLWISLLVVTVVFTVVRNLPGNPLAS